VERELIMTGIGGQGVQLAAAVVARAALLEGRDIQVFGSYGGMMRGGATESTVVVADRPVEAPPTVGTTWSALLMHHEHARPVLARLDPQGVALVNTDVVDRPDLPDTCTVVEVTANEIALALGSALAASMVMVGAYAATTGLVGLDSLAAASRASLPSYRTQHAALNEQALRAGFDSVSLSIPAWSDAVGTR
jgi:Pyruvate/2-oxoacid:ferredoxin oxidoreductase gamma subunit